MMKSVQINFKYLEKSPKRLDYEENHLDYDEKCPD